MSAASKPININFASGPCAKRRDWSFDGNDYVFAGRSHRSEEAIEKIQSVINLQKEVLSLPDDYLVGIVSASATGAMETLLWNLIGPRGVDILSVCTFSKIWAADVIDELKITDAMELQSDFGRIDHVQEINFQKDVVFCWTSTTSGVSVQNADWIPNDREGLTICDATSAAFTADIDWSKIDAAAFSWQKGLGGEAGIGTIIISPRAVERMESFCPDRPIPRIFRIKNKDKINYNIFRGYTINTPSMMCIEEFYGNLMWAKKIGGMTGLLQKVDDNYGAFCNWMRGQSDFYFLSEEEHRAHNVVCIDIANEEYQKLDIDKKWEMLKKIVATCNQENIGRDFLGHILTQPHLRIWLGPTIESLDVQKFLECLSNVYKMLYTSA